MTHIDELVKVPHTVTPAKAGVQKPLKWLDPRLRRDDKTTLSATFYESINIAVPEELSAPPTLF